MRAAGEMAPEIDGAKTARVNEQSIVQQNAALRVPREDLERLRDALGEAIIAEVIAQMPSDGVEDAARDLVSEQISSGRIGFVHGELRVEVRARRPGLPRRAGWARRRRAHVHGKYSRTCADRSARA